MIYIIIYLKSLRLTFCVLRKAIKFDLGQKIVEIIVFNLPCISAIDNQNSNMSLSCTGIVVIFGLKSCHGCLRVGRG